MAEGRVIDLSKADLTGPDMARWYLAGEAKVVAAALRVDGRMSWP
jgi:hypothetical protein